MTYLEDFFNLLIPELCVTCGTSLVFGEKVLCLKCCYDLPRTRFESAVDNPVAQLFWGRMPLEYAGSFFRYQTGSRFRMLIHDLKYRERKDIGKVLGKMMGMELRDTPFRSVDMILPVPLHRSKLRKRGYNQCDPIGEGLSESLGIPFYSGLLERFRESGSQTRHTRFKRWINVEDSFRVREPELLHRNHILLIDDVVTTGSTLEACARVILELGDTKVSIATLAVALKTY